MNYRTTLIGRFWDFAEGENLTKFLDRDRSTSRPPVFKKEHAHLNLLYDDTADSNYRSQLIDIIPQTGRHRWFRSMMSSQALAQSVFGNLHLLGLIDTIASLKTEEGLPFFEFPPSKVNLEYAVDSLGEPRPTSVDVLIEGPDMYRIAVECKLSEPEIGTCSRPRLKPNDSNYSRDYCDGSYSLQRDREKRCSLSAVGVQYWDHIPSLFNWSSGLDYPECPLRYTYQLVRNVLASCTREGAAKELTTTSPEHGHAVLLYDDRNPVFANGGSGDRVFRKVGNALSDTSLIRRCSWQALLGKLRQVPQLGWLVDGIARKYGIEESGPSDT